MIRDMIDSGASIMARGGKYGDTVAFDKLRDELQGWVEEPLGAEQLQTEDEGGEDEDEDDAKRESGLSGAGAAAAQGQVLRNAASAAASAAEDAAPSSQNHRLQPSQS